MRGILPRMRKPKAPDQAAVETVTQPEPAPAPEPKPTAPREPFILGIELEPPDKPAWSKQEKKPRSRDRKTRNNSADYIEDPEDPIDPGDPGQRTKDRPPGINYSQQSPWLTAPIRETEKTRFFMGDRKEDPMDEKPKQECSECTHDKSCPYWGAAKSPARCGCFKQKAQPDD